MKALHASLELRHLAGLPEGLPTVETPGFRKTQLVVAQAVEHNEIAAITGEAGLGKSFAVDYAVKAADLPYLWVQVAAAPSPKEVTAGLARRLGVEVGRRTLYELADDVIEELVEETHIVVVDESQNLKKKGLDQIRYLHDVADASFPLLFVGGEFCAEVLQSDPQLADRVGGWTAFKRLGRRELFEVLDAYHPFFAASDKELIAEMDRVYAQGVFRRWARVLQKALPLAAKTETPGSAHPGGSESCPGDGEGEPMNPRVKITVAASDSDHVTFLNSLNNFEEGVVSFRVRPDYNAHTGIISYDIMAAMGASEDVSGPGRKSSHNPLHMPVWLVANRITDVVVCAAESLSAEVLHDLAATAFQTRIKFWFVFDHELPEKLLKAVSEWCPEPVSPEAFETRWKGRARPEERVQADDPSDGWPRRLPEDEFPLFLAQVKAQLSPNQARLVEAEFRDSVATAARSLDELGTVSEEEVAQLLRAHLRGSSLKSQTLTRIRGFQVAAFHRGWLLKVDHAALLSSEVAEFNAAADDPGAWRLLRSYRQPFRGAANACLAAGVEPDDMPKIRVSDVPPSGDTVTIEGRQAAVPEGGRVFIRALRLERLGDGAASATPVFTDYSKGPQQPFLLVRALNAAAREIGVGLITSRLKKHGGKPRNWQARHGIALEELATVPEVADA